MSAEPGAMRIALAQLNMKVGAIAENQAKMVEVIERARAEGADLVVFSEVALLGYPPRDLVHRRELLARQREALAEIAALTTEELAVLVGVVDRADANATGPSLINAAAFCRAGKIERVIAKTLFPSYDVFDEDRYFTADDGDKVVEHQGVRLGISICEDAWARVQTPEMPRHRVDPVARLVEAGSEILINLSASPFSLGKAEFRRALLVDHARTHGQAMVFVNQVGANDELIFDGSSLVIDARGEVRARLKSFGEDVQVVTVKNGEVLGGEMAGIFETKAEQARAAVVLGIRDYVQKSGFSGVILGLSGGIDSALTVALATEALGPQNVTALAMPSRFSSDHSREDARALAENLGIEFHEVSIEAPFQATLETLDPLFEGRPFDVTEENLQARLRGIYLMAMSNKFGRLVLACGNKSELAVGYSTLYGDLTGALAPIGDLPKLLVYEIAGLINREAGRDVICERIIEKAPSAELRPDQKDADSLPPYEVLDAIVDRYVVEHQTTEEIIAGGYERATVERIIGLIHRAEYKRWQAPPILKVTTKAFGVGWRYPLAKSV